MDELAATPLRAWETFYVIVGSSSAALTGLMFVVVSLIPDARARLPASSATISAFATPTVVHFCGALLVSGILSAPWNAMEQAGLSIAASGLAGVLYVIIVIRRMRGQTDYKPVLEDWSWHGLLPLAAYVVLVISGMLVSSRPIGALFATGTAALLLLFIGIHNAWDTVTFVTLERSTAPEETPTEPRTTRQKT